MSYKDADLVRNLVVGNPTAKSVLRCLADFKNGSNGQCNPSVDSIVSETEFDRKTVFKAIKYLEEAGFIKKSRTIKNGSNNYELFLTKAAYQLPEKKPRSTKSGSTKSGTSNNGSTKSGTCVVPKVGRAVVPKVEHEPVIEPIKEPINNLIAAYPKKDLFGEIEEPTPIKNTKPAPKTHLFNLETLPGSWREYCKNVRPELNPELVFHEFKFYYKYGKGASTRSADKGWNQRWQNWVRNTYENQSNRTPPANQQTNQFVHIDKNGIRQSGFDADYYKDDIEDDG